MSRIDIQRCRQELRDLLELVLLPGLAVVLPWALCFACFKALARWQWLYRGACDRALAEAKARTSVADEAHWLWTRRLVTLVDHADLYLSLTRSDAWMRKHLRVHGAWPVAGQTGLLCTFHWGAGMWALRHAASQGLTPNALVASLDPAYFVQRKVLYRYALARTGEVAHVLQRPTIDVTRQLRNVLKAFRQGEPILAAIDAPADQADACQYITLQGMTARVPTALLRLAVEKQIPVTVYTTGLDMRSGQRVLHVQTLAVSRDLESLVMQVFERLDDVMTQDAAAWHFWSEAPRFFVAPSA